MDLRAVVSRHVLLKPLSEGYVGCCPFHDGSESRLIVVPEIDHYECLCCGATGDAADFIIRMKRKRAEGYEDKRDLRRKGCVYVLELEGGNYYVGFSVGLEQRLQKHFLDRGAYWTKKHKPLRVVETYPNVPFSKENEITELYMRRYGWEKVRGGDYCSLIKGYADLKVIKKTKRIHSGVYLLKLTGAHYYVGYAEDIEADIALQYRGQGCAWTKLHPPVKVIGRVRTESLADHKTVTLETMKKYGWRSVRGYIWLSINSWCPDELRDYLFDDLLEGNYYLS